MNSAEYSVFELGKSELWKHLLQAVKLLKNTWHSAESLHFHDAR